MKDLNLNEEDKSNMSDKFVYFDKNDEIDDLELSNRMDIRVYQERCKELEKALTEARSALDDFQVTSKELEDALEQELEHMEKQYQKLKERNSFLEKELDVWKTKYHELRNEDMISITAMQREIETLREAHRLIKSKMTDLELSNDAMERKERVVQSSFEDLEIKYNKAMEENAFLEVELVAKKSLETENQRLKDELQDTQLELSLVKEKFEKIKIEKEMASKALLWHQEHHPSDTSQQPTTQMDVIQEKGLSEQITGSKSRISGSRIEEGHIRSHSIKMMQEMSKRVKNLELRLQSCRILVKPLLLRPKPSHRSNPVAMAVESEQNQDKVLKTPKQSHYQHISPPSKPLHLHESFEAPLISPPEPLTRRKSMIYHLREPMTPVGTIMKTSCMTDVSKSKTNLQKIPSQLENDSSRTFRRFSIKKMTLDLSPAKSPKRQAIPSAIPVYTETPKRRVSGIPQSISPKKITQNFLKKKNSAFEISNYVQKKVIHMPSLSNLPKYT